MWEILVPCVMNNRPVRTRHHKEWDKYVRKLAGGLTIFRPAKGNWFNPGSGELFVERMIPVRIHTTEKNINLIIDFTMNHYKQLAVMAYVVSEKVILRYKDEVNQNIKER